MTAVLAAACAGPQREPAVRGLPKDDVLAGAVSAVWVGHATVLLRFGNRYVLTDPNLGGAILIQARETPASLRPDQLPPIQIALVSHLHVDHFDGWTMSHLPASTILLFPLGAEQYFSSLKQVDKETLAPWHSVTRDGIRVTAVPVVHAGGRYILDALWNHSFCGFILEAEGRKVFFAGDTGYDESAFKEIGRRFPGIDLAFIPIAPAKGKNRNHADPVEAVQIFRDVGARYMVPIHFEAYHSMAVPLDLPRKQLAAEAERLQLTDRIYALHTGEGLLLPDDNTPPRVLNEPR